MAFIQNSISFISAALLMLAAWLAYLWCNNLLSRLPTSPWREIIGGALSFVLLAAIGIILYFFSLPFSMGVLTIAVLLMVGYAIRKTLHSRLA